MSLQDSEIKYWQYSDGINLVHWNFTGLKRRYSVARMTRFSDCLVKGVGMIDRGISERGFELSIIVCDPVTIRELKKQYFNLDQETDVIALSMIEGDFKQFCDSMLGDIYICHDVIRSNSSRYAMKLDEEIAFVLIHGLLHLFSYDDSEPDEQEAMFEFQKRILENCFRRGL